MKPFAIKVLTPEKIMYEGEATCVSMRTTEGSIGILCGHEPMVASLPSTPVKISFPDGTQRVASLSKGMLKVTSNEVKILGAAMEWADEIDINWAERSKEDALRKKAEAKTEHEMNRAEAKLQRALNRIKIQKMK